MSITVNGRKEDHIPGESLSALLERLNYVFPLVVVRIDDRFVPHGDYPSTTIEDGSNVIVLHLTSGG